VAAPAAEPAAPAAARLAATGGVAGLVLLAYPLVPPGSGKEPRSEHWPGIRVPTLFVQGERDRFATPDVLAREAAARMGGPWTLRAIPGAGHGWRQAAVGDVAAVVTGWVDTVVAG
jgi:uncharacterized protein